MLTECKIFQFMMLNIFFQKLMQTIVLYLFYLILHTESIQIFYKILKLYQGKKVKSKNIEPILFLFFNKFLASY